jgi:hypothetical protein
MQRGIERTEKSYLKGSLIIEVRRFILEHECDSQDNIVIQQHSLSED